MAESSRWADISGTRLEISRAGFSASSSRTAAGTAKRPEANVPPTTPRSACSKGLWQRSARSARSHALGAAIGATRRRAEEYLLQRSLFRRLATGEVADSSLLQFAFPPRYVYNVLRALDYFRDAGGPPDARMREAIRIVRERQSGDGRWILDATHNESLAFPFHESPGEPSRWITLLALRVLRWAEG